jgi:glutaminase
MDSNELRELEIFLQNCYTSLESDRSGKVADYIPYLSKVSPSKFAISLCTVEGHIDINFYMFMEDI